jgi:hypothetical protein
LGNATLALGFPRIKSGVSTNLHDLVGWADPDPAGKARHSRPRRWAKPLSRKKLAATAKLNAPAKSADPQSAIPAQSAGHSAPRKLS